MRLAVRWPKKCLERMSKLSGFEPGKMKEKPKRKPPANNRTKCNGPTFNQMKFIKFYLESGNGADAARKAGYSEKHANTVAQRLLTYVDIQETIERCLKKAGISEELIALKIREGVEATETKFFQKDGEVVTECEVIPWGIRLDYLQFAARLLGLLKEKVEVDPGDKPIELRVVKRIARKSAGEIKPGERDGEGANA